MAWLASTPSAGPSRFLVDPPTTAPRPQAGGRDLWPKAEHDPLGRSHLLHHQCGPGEAVPAHSRTSYWTTPARGLRSALRDWGLIVVCPSLEDAARLKRSLRPGATLNFLVGSGRNPWPNGFPCRAIFLGGLEPGGGGVDLPGWPQHTLPTSGTAASLSALSV